MSSENRNPSDRIIDSANGGVHKHIGQIADSMTEWQGPIAEELNLTPAQISGIREMYPGNLSLQGRKALQIWTEKSGDKATYKNLEKVFEKAGYCNLACKVKKLADELSTNTSTGMERSSTKSTLPIEDSRLRGEQDTSTGMERSSTKSTLPIEDSGLRGEQDTFTGMERSSTKSTLPIEDSRLRGEQGVRLTDKTLSFVFRQLKIHAYKWREIGLHLGFLPGELSNIEARPTLIKDAPVSCLGALLEESTKWAPGDSRGSTGFTTLDSLKAALMHAGLAAAAHDLKIKTEFGVAVHSEDREKKRKMLHFSYRCVIIILLCLTLLAILMTLTFALASTSQSTHTVHNHDGLDFGRQAIIENLTEALLGEQYHAVLISGQFGMGKTSIVLNATEILSNKGLCIVYVDCLDVDDLCIGESHLFKLIVEKQDGLILNKYPCITHFRNIIQSYKPHSKMTVQLWQRYLSTYSVLILDNYNTSSEPKSFTTLLENGYLKVVLVSEYKVKISGSHYHLPITRPETKDCITYVTTRYSDLELSITSATDLCNVLDGIPLAIFLTANYLRGITTFSVTEVLDLLKSSEYNEAFESFVAMVDIPNDNVPVSLSLVRTLGMIYNTLKLECQQCAFNLAELPLDQGFTWEEASKSFYRDLTNATFLSGCIDELLRYSLLQSQSGRFKFLPFIKKFIHGYKPATFDGRSPKAFSKFWANVYIYYAEILQQQLAKENVFTAMNIGVNQELVNSLLPLLNVFPIKQLFHSALDVISICCQDNVACIGESDRFVYAFSRLTKAVHCPMMQADAVILNANGRAEDTVNNQLVHCHEHLQKCEKKLVYQNQQSLALYKDDVAVGEEAFVEAYGYYNLLLMSTVPDSVPWEASLVDLSAFLTSIVRSYAPQRYVHPHATASTAQNFVNGLKYFVLKDSDESVHHLTAVMNNLHDDHECHSILRLIVTATLYVECNPQLCGNLKAYLHSVQLKNLKMDCYLGVMNDIILPFLNVVRDKYLIPTKALNNTFSVLLNKEIDICQGKESISKFDCSPLNRYRGIQSRRLLRTRPKDVRKILSQYSPSDPAWVCSVIKDKTTKCNGDWPPLSAQYMTDYNDLFRQYLVSLRWFMDDSEFARWNQSFHSLIDLNLYPYFD